MKRLIPAFVVALFATFVSATPAGAAFGFEGVDLTFAGPDGSPEMQAGSHPFAMTTTLDFNTAIDSGSGEEVIVGSPRDLVMALPPGLATHLRTVPACATADFLQVDVDHPTSNCSDSTALGVLRARAPGEAPGDPSPIFNLVSASGAAGTLGLIVDATPVKLVVGVRPSPPYGLVLTLDDLPEAAGFAGYELTLWGTPADPMHDEERGHCASGVGVCPTAVPEVPFLTLPRSCIGPLATGFEADSWESPGAWAQAQAITHDGAEPSNPLGMSGCAKLDFGPSAFALPTTDQAGSPSGLDVDLGVFDDGLANPVGLAQSDIKRVVLALPEGMTVNPSVVQGLVACTPAQLAAERADSEPGEGCPEASEIGAVEVETPLLEGAILEGRLFVASRGAAQVPLYLVVKHSGLGILLKLSGEVESDPVSGQLVTTFDQVPQFPVSHVGVHLREDGPLLTPSACGKYASAVGFTPSARPATLLIVPSSFEVTAGAGGGPCPSGTPPPGAGCDGGACQSPAATPIPTLGTAKTKPKPRCPKGKRKVRRAGKVRCVAKQKHERIRK
jgi:hypothetical protein